MKLHIIIALLLLGGTAGFAMPAEKASMDEAFGRLPLYFIENRGQVGEEAAFYVQGLNKILYFTPRGITFALTDGEGGDASRWAVKLEFVGSNPKVALKGEDKQKAVFSYFKGSAANWKTGIPAYSRLVYADLWPGIDLVYSGTVNRVKYEFVVKPGADPGMIRLRYRGATDVAVKKTGELEVTTPAGGFEDGAPYAYQVLNGERVEVSMRYAMEKNARDGNYSYGFDVGSFDSTEPLILDPSMFIYCGYIGGSDGESGSRIEVDAHGCAYVMGMTNTTESSFPVLVGPDLSYNGVTDVFVAKVKADGTGLIYCGYIGGDQYDYGRDLAVDGLGNAYVTGHTKSKPPSFPVTVGPDLTHNGGFYGWDAYVAKVNAAGTHLDYCGYIGGNKEDHGYGVAVDGYGNAYVAGYTESQPKHGFPVLVGPDLTFNGSTMDCFVAKVKADGTGLLYCGYIGGAGGDYGYDIAVDIQGSAYVAGSTSSSQSSFPVLKGPHLIYSGLTDTFVAKVTADGTGLLYCGYIGGEKADHCHCIAIDNSGSAYVAGSTSSTETTFPVVVGPDLTFNGYVDAYAARVNANGTQLDWCGYIGGDEEDSCKGIAVDDQGNACVAGYAYSSESEGFPVTAGPDLTFNGYRDAFVARINWKGTHLDYCGYIGGYEKDYGYDIAVDHLGDAYVTGGTVCSASQGFPLHVGPDLTHNGDGDAFVAKLTLALASDNRAIPESIGGVVKFALTAGTVNASRNYLMVGSITGTEPGTPLPGGMETLPLNWDIFTSLVVTLMNGPVFTNFMGTLDGWGKAVAQFNTLGPLPPGSAGLKMYFAYALSNPWDFASNPVTIEIVP